MQSTTDVQALVLEVAEKHDVICKLRQQLCCKDEHEKQKDAHRCYKEKVIRDLRREIKKVRTHITNR